MIDFAPLLFSFDLTGTLADIDGISHVEHIRRASPLPAADVRRILYHDLGLKTLPSRDALTEEMIEHACAALRIDRVDFRFDSEPLAPYRLREDAAAAVSTARRYLPTALITNTSVFADPCLRPVSIGLHPHLDAIHCSWAVGHAKPDPQIFRLAASYHCMTAQHMIHIGDSWYEDVVPVLALGGRAVWLNPAAELVPGSEPVPRGRLVVARTVTEAVEQAVARWLS